MNDSYPRVYANQRKVLSEKKSIRSMLANPFQSATGIVICVQSTSRAYSGGVFVWSDEYAGTGELGIE